MRCTLLIPDLFDRVGVAMGVWEAGGISGGHINPAVTISLAVFRGFPWRKVPGYILAQVLGSMTAAGTTYGLYRGAINIYEGGESIRTVSGDTATASLFSTYPRECPGLHDPLYRMKLIPSFFQSRT